MGILEGPRRKEKGNGRRVLCHIKYLLFCSLTLEYLSNQEEDWLVFKGLRA